MIYRNIHAWNILLMGISLLIAFLVPFELFLIAYATLGPLHYLTEINWLNNNNFYVRTKKYIWVLVALTFIASLPALLSGVYPLSGSHEIGSVLGAISQSYAVVILMCLMVAALLAVEIKRGVLVVIVLVVGVSIFLFQFLPALYVLAGVLIPSVIHVYVFTLLFMLYGVIKKPSQLGFSEVMALVIAPLLIVFWPIDPANYCIASETLTIYRESKFENLNLGLSRLLRNSVDQDLMRFIFSETGVKIQIFIAFAYTHHYLNWFSKISLIGWLKNESYKKISLLLGLWVVSVGLYLFDYRMGLASLFFLSLLHVTLEFPLNILSAQAVISSCLNLFRAKTR